MMNSPDRITIRSKILGVLIRDARLKSHHSLDDCAAALGISAEKLEDFEFGVKAPSLPELEILAQTLDVPLEHFWGRTLIAPKTSTSHRDPDSLIKIRHKLIGARLRKARNEAGIALEQAAVQVGMSAQELEDSE